MGEDIVVCDGCDAPFHLRCVGLKAISVADWFCPACGGEEAGGNGCSPSSSEPSQLTKLQQMRKARAKAKGGSKQQNGGGGKLLEGRKRLRRG